MTVSAKDVGRFLESQLKAKRVTNYGVVAAQFGLPEFDGAWAAHPLSDIFEVLDQEDALSNRPFRTSVVIAANSNAPGPGLFEAMARLKGVPDPKTSDARERLWLAELNAAYAHKW
jgi:hypothetical protein